ncbi:iron complex outermembrane receptor protein [Mariniflexile fucanivorans]|uniref:Iron complex outermembrane receptor protein n=1 Tax=Mariniflexile fucanivorans TaxID=264023 RepID=A0A4R1RFV9_9FLAO|nr:TonB-dependent receptor [Mariniflexile fucanivorans]TCL64472.1 iron complex outermembrane receptor protein [Mariniflexile fucanivorans]
MKKIILFLLFTSIWQHGFSQFITDSIQILDEVVLSDSKLIHYASGVKQSVLNDSVLKQNSKSLTTLLTFNSNLYFKENGYGMVSSPSFRGTNASQTAVIWNGININSQLNGQTDFNTINTSNYNSIAIRSGGGSVQYGSGAIGGSIHLNNKLAFYSHFDNSVQVSYGSFNTKQTGFNSSYGSDAFTVDFGLFYVKSDNDYKYLGTNKVNENGAFENLNLNVNLGYFISKKDVLKLYSQSYIGDREFSGTLVAPPRSKYEDENYRTMLDWVRISGKFNSSLKVGYLQEKFKYFENKNTDNYTFGKVNTYLVNHSLNVRLSEKLQFKTILDFNSYEGAGSSFGDPKRRAFSTTALLNHKLTDKLNYGINLRKDFTSGFESPFVFSLDAAYQVTGLYKIQINGSKNYRVPTFNDLYWNPGGNLDLVPESSYQVDFGQQLQFKHVNFKLNGYYINTEYLIQWQPALDDMGKPILDGMYTPLNVAETQSYGAELELESDYKVKGHHFNLNAHYSYTVSENLKTKKQLIYVPFHKGNVNLAYGYKKFNMYYQHMFNGEVSIISSSLNAYNVGNVGLGYVLNKNGTINYEINFKVNNLYNTYYENVALRPMPNRNYQIQTIIKF